MAINFSTIWNGLKLKAKAVLTSDTAGEMEVSSVDNKTYLHDGAIRSPIVTEATASSLNNKDLVDSTTNITDNTDPTIRINFDADGTASTRTTIQSSQTVDRTVTLPDATDTLVGKATTDTLTNKTIDANGVGNSISNLEVADLAAGVLNTSVTMTGASDTQVPSALAIKTYVDNSTGSTQTDVDDLIILSGVPANSVDLGTFTGTTITDDQTIKGALQDLETGLEAHIADTVDAHDASAISVVAIPGVTGTEVQSVLESLKSQIVAGGNGDVFGPASSTDNAIARFDSTTGKLIQDSVVTVSDTGVIAGASIDADTNTITNIENADIKVGAAIDATKIADGSVTSAEFQYLGGVTSDIQTQIDSKVDETGGTIITPARLDMKQDTLANLTTYALTATNGQLVFATDTKSTFVVKDGLLSVVGGGGTGLPAPGASGNVLTSDGTDWVSNAPSGSTTYNATLSNGLIYPIWDFTTPTKLADPATLPVGNGYGTAWSPDGQFLSVAHFTTPFITIYQRSGTTFTKLANPAALPASTARGTAWSPDGQFLSVSHNTTPFITIYQRSGTTFTKLANPATLPTGGGKGTSWSPDGQFLSVAHFTTPFITIYQRSGTTFTKLADPAALPASTGNGASWSPDGQFLSVTHDTTPFITIYQRSGTTFTKLADPASLPPGNGRGTAWSPDGQFLSVVHDTTPFITIYQRSGTTFTKLANPASLPTGNGTGTAWSPDGQFLSVVHDTTPFITIYQRSGTTFTKLANPASLPSQVVLGTAWSPDGQFLSVSHSTTPFITTYRTSSNTPSAIGSPVTVNVINREIR